MNTVKAKKNSHPKGDTYFLLMIYIRVYLCSSVVNALFRINED